MRGNVYYHPSKLVCLKAKGDVWYVQVTKPTELQVKNNKQVRRSTGTTDKKEAERRQHRITEEIYAFFDAEIDLLTPQPPVKIVYSSEPPDPLYQFRPKPIIPKADASLRLSRIWPKYIEGRNWRREKTKNGIKSHLKEFLSVVGDLQVDQIKKKHGYQYARFLDQTGYSNSTVGTRVRAVGSMLTWCEEHDIIENHTLRNLNLKDYGYPGRPWKPFPAEDLQSIFSQELPQQERLCLSLLAITGARLDEIALLRWSQVKSTNGIKYLDLTEAIVKTPGSNRLVPLHKNFAMPEASEGRIFDYPEGQDGKSQNNASRDMMPFIRSAVGDDDRKALHSFRGTLKDMLRNAGVSKELNDFFTGHSSGDVAGDYGEGHSLAKRFEAINKVDIEFLGPELLSN
ncbi:Phage integrase [Roseobacter sp. SK209-2-6]|nr:Phage integrase [Roseobacter sp. SK209-2-6]